jgi:amino acid transporter
MQGSSFIVTTQQFIDLPRTIPLVLYAMVGFEAACSLSNHIKDAQKNAPLAIFISYGIVLTILCLYQLFFYGILGTNLAAQPDYRHAFPLLLYYLMPHHTSLALIIVSILHLGIAASALGGAYGIIFINNWNLYTLAQHGHIFAANRITQLNHNHIPWLCVIIEGIICILYLLITQGSQIPLQQMSALGSTIAYTLSVTSLLYAKKNNSSITISWWIPILGLCNCLILLVACLYSFWYKGAYSLILFASLLLFGIWMFFQTRTSSQLNRN